MARTFASASSQSLSNGTAVLTAAPLTMACRIKAATLANSRGLMSLCDTAATFNRFSLTIDSAGTISAQTVDATTSRAATKGTVSTGTWYHAAAVFASASSRTAYLDGVAGTAETTSLTPTAASMNRTLIALARQDNPIYFNGDIAEAAIWSAALTVDELLALTKGACPLLIRPSALEGYWPIWGRGSPELDLAGVYPMTVFNGPAAADHPRVYRRRQPITYFVPTGGGAYTLTADAGSFALSGQPVALTVARRLSAASGSFALAGQSAGLLVARRLTATAGSFTLTGQPANLLAARRLSAASGSFTLTGQPAGLFKGRTLTADAGTFALTGQPAALRRTLLLPAGLGTFTLTGAPAGLLTTRRLVATAGTYALTGQPATLTITGGGPLPFLRVAVTCTLRRGGSATGTLRRRGAATCVRR